MPQKTPKFAAEICLYGTREAGAGYIARLATGEMTDADVKKDRTFTEAIYMAHGALQALQKCLKGGSLKGTCRIYDAGGTRCVDLDLDGAFPNYGALSWKPAQVYVLPLKTLIENADKPPLEAEMWAGLDQASRRELIRAAHSFKGVDAEKVLDELQDKSWAELPRATQARIMRDLSTVQATTANSAKADEADYKSAGNNLLDASRRQT